MFLNICVIFFQSCLTTWLPSFHPRFWMNPLPGPVSDSLFQIDHEPDGSAYPPINSSILPQISNKILSFVFCMIEQSVHACSSVSSSLQPHGLQPSRLLCLWNTPGKKTGVGCHFLLQGIFLVQRSNLPLLHWHWTTWEAPKNREVATDLSIACLTLKKRVMMIEEAEKQHQATAKQGASWVNLLSNSSFSLYYFYDIRQEMMRPMWMSENRHIARKEVLHGSRMLDKVL